MFIYQALLEPLGFVAASMLAIIVLTVLGGERRAYVVLPVAILVPLGLYWFFTVAASVQIPMGYFESWVT